MKKVLSTFLFSMLAFAASSQVLSNKEKYTEADTLRGSLRAERAYDALKYHLKLKVDPSEKFIGGTNIITFKTEEELPVIQIDLFENMDIDSIVYHGKNLQYNRKYNAVFIEFGEALAKNTTDSLEFFYSGHPTVAKNAPWDGGFVWTQDEQGNPWVGVAVQGTGASLWYPNKDHQSDEPESVQLDIAVPNGLMNVSNGRMIGKKDLGNGYTEWSWETVNPINNYDVMINIANYEHFSDKFQDLTLDYYVLPYNLEKAKKHFEEVQDMMTCFYEKMGPYPFVEDGYKLVETPYLGMEHQSAVAYGNKYMKGYLGNDLSGTGVGLKWDYIIIHESGHEWYGNSITAKDIADMWIHEGFTTYTEAIYTECGWGKEAALKYIKGQRANIQNRATIIGDYGVNAEGSGDMYFKGSNLLNTIRSIYDNDELWWDTFRDYTATYKHKIIDTKTVEDFFDKPIKTDLKPVFDQYLRHTRIPELQFRKEGKTFAYRWRADAEGFNMPVDVFIDGKETRLKPTMEWKKLDKKVSSEDAIKLNDLEFYVNIKFES
ncbi:M1 family metallopeptidase [Zunongwangia sp. SCSIO 43204]|uniref:M1 family metallopeptidase n=1 Tax=Zunongwangia sp. SCSIO 43204 TaxID=2779359 RepID=UPI001CA94A1C|nr:M1 family metallopeptidase [Zunongwangia sp. SCSIO 43204]UAB86290.1 M1 family metallopeptidase [Zunongwangia sp. SCSIO 43204]